MQSNTERPAFVPPEPPGRLRSISLAIAAHLALGAILYFGTNWRLSSDLPSFEAEVWSSVPQEAAPPASSTAQPEPSPQPQPRTAPEPCLLYTSDAADE